MIETNTCPWYPCIVSVESNRTVETPLDHTTYTHKPQRHRRKAGGSRSQPSKNDADCLPRLPLRRGGRYAARRVPRCRACGSVSVCIGVCVSVELDHPHPARIDKAGGARTGLSQNPSAPPTTHTPPRQQLPPRQGADQEALLAGLGSIRELQGEWGLGVGRVVRSRVGVCGSLCVCVCVYIYACVYGLGLYGSFDAGAPTHPPTHPKSPTSIQPSPGTHRGDAREGLVGVRPRGGAGRGRGRGGRGGGVLHAWGWGGGWEWGGVRWGAWALPQP